jgi:hypothetical protein
MNSAAEGDQGNRRIFSCCLFIWGQPKALARRAIAEMKVPRDITSTIIPRWARRARATSLRCMFSPRLAESGRGRIVR